jgi:hypothetical protein
MTLPLADIESALLAALPAGLHSHATSLARLLADASDGAMATGEAQARFVAEPAFAAAFEALAGKRIGPVLSFGAGNQIGDVIVGDVADGPILKSEVLNIGGDVGRNVFDFGAGNTIGNVTMGDVAGRDIRKVTITNAATAAVPGEQEWLAWIDQVRADVDRLTDAPRGQRQDADDELRKAREAIEEGNRSRLLEKLEGAQKILRSLGVRTPAALPVAEAVGTLIQKVMSARG